MRFGIALFNVDSKPWMVPYCSSQLVMHPHSHLCVMSIPEGIYILVPSYYSIC